MRFLNKTLTKRWIVPAAIAALSVAGSPLAHAGSTAYTQLEVTQGLFINADTGNALRLVFDLGIGADDFEERGQVTANRIDGAGAGFAEDEGIDANPFNGVNLSNTALGAANIDQVCVGTGCGAAPNFPAAFQQGDVTMDEYNRAALEVSGTGLSFFGLFDDPNSTQLVAEAITQGSSNDIAISSLANSTTFTFRPLEDAPVGFTGVIDRAVDLFLDDAANSGTAISTIGFTFSVFEVGGGPLGLTVVGDPTLVLSTNTPGAGGQISFADQFNYSATTNDALESGKEYTLSIAWNVRSDLNVDFPVPEPAPLGLLGLGLLAVPMMKRWKKASA